MTKPTNPNQKTIPYQSIDKTDCGTKEPKDTKKTRDRQLLGAIKIDLRPFPNFTQFSKFSK